VRNTPGQVIRSAAVPATLASPHGQIKLALKVAGHPIDDDEAGPLTWDIWKRKRAT